MLEEVDVQPEASVGDPTSVPQEFTSEDLWLRAEEELCKDEKRKKVFQEFVSILENEHGSKPAPFSVVRDQERLREFLTRKTKELEERTKRCTFARFSNSTLVAKDVLAALGSTHPPATSIAFAGIVVTLNVCSYVFVPNRNLNLV